MTNTRWITTKGLSAALITFFISSHAFSKSQINSEFELTLPRQFQQHLIEKKWESLVNKEFQANWQFPDQQMNAQEVPVRIRQLSLKVKTLLQKPSLEESQSILKLSSKNLQAELHMGEVSVDHVVERVVGGIIGRFRVQAQCKDVVLNLQPGKGSFSVILSPQVENVKAGIQVESVDLAWLPGSWVAQGFQCEGVEGFEELIRAEINKIANDSVRFVEPQKELIKKYVQESLQSFQFDYSQMRQLIAVRPDIRLLMKVDEYRDLGGNGAKLKGQLEIEFLRAPDQALKTLTLSASTDSERASEAQLRLPKDFLKEVLLRSYSANSWLHQVTSDRIPGFSSVMGSRLVQFFIWPELMKYPKSSRFKFDVYSNKDIGIQGDGLRYQVKAPLYSKMMAPKENTYVPFMNFSMPFTSSVQLKVSGGQAQATFVNPTLSLSSSWDNVYVNRYNPSRRFSSNTIRDRIVSSLDGKTVSVALPKIPVAEGISLTIHKMLAPAGKDIVFQLVP